MNNKHMKIAARYKQAGPSRALLAALFRNYGKGMGRWGRDMAAKAVGGFMPGAGIGAVGGFIMPGTQKDLLGRPVSPTFSDRMQSALRGGMYGGLAGAVGNVALGRRGYRPPKSGQPTQPTQPAKSQPAKATADTQGVGRGKTQQPQQTQQTQTQQPQQPQPQAQMRPQPQAQMRPQPQAQAQALDPAAKRHLSQWGAGVNRYKVDPLAAKKPGQILRDQQATRTQWEGSVMGPEYYLNQGYNMNKFGSMKARHLSKIALARYPEKYREKVAAMGLLANIGGGLATTGVLGALGYGLYQKLKNHQPEGKTMPLNPFANIGNAFSKAQNQANTQKGQ